AALMFPQQFLTADSGRTKADVIVILGGSWNERAQRAAELFKENAAPAVLVSGWGDCEINRKLLVGAGVPSQAIQTECESRNTKENAQFSLKWLRDHHARRVIIVTSWYHSRRALACFRHYGNDIEFLSRPSYYAYPRSEWPQKAVPRHIRSEYVKLLGYWVYYGICPL
ncbi:MAG TPA: YdcF family protein, partial [Candidatus Dormibacteraeota bacterium]|nr:YdcF family protein [Candidatus Dormibacteraeota bacterium]